MTQLFNNDAFSTLEEAVNLICNAVKVTLGPRGKNVLTINNYGDAHLTKDGITVAKSVKSKDPIINGILNVVREASSNTAKTAGDGTTTSLVLTQELFNKGLQLIKNGSNPTLLKQGMNYALKDVVDYIENHSEKITIADKDKLFSIAKISSNMDEEVSNIATAAIIETEGTGICRIDTSRTNDTIIKCNNGLTLDKGYISPSFLYGEDAIIKYDNPFIFVSSIELSNKTIVDLMKHSRDNNRPIIVIAPDFNENIFMSMFRNFKAGTVQLCPIKTPGFANNRNQWLEDIVAYIGGEIYTNNNISPIKFIGKSDNIIISSEETIISNSVSTSSCIEHISKLQNRLLHNTDDVEKESLSNRIARLQGKIVTIYVGATTELELNEKKDRIEDAVCALQTALKGGISEGGGMTFMRCSIDNYNECSNTNSQIDGYNLVMNAILIPFEQLCINCDLDYKEIYSQWDYERDDVGYNFKTLCWENLKESGVIDPTLVLKNAITNAVGIVSNLLMTECITYYE